jgi:aspartate aminotransferase
MMNRAASLRRQGRDVVSLSAGEPDFDTPRPIVDAAIDALNRGQTRYTSTFGPPEARQAIARKLERENGIGGLTAEHVAISAGAKHALYGVCQCLFDEPATGGQPAELLLPVPAWVSYKPLAELSGASVVPLETSPATGFKVTPEQVRRALTPRARALLINSPGNPCGSMYTREELDAIASAVAEGAQEACPEIVIITDEIYEKITLGGVEHASIGRDPRVAGRTVTINGLSKAYAMTGWRVGYAACPGEFGLRLMRALAALQGQMTTNITSFVYAAIPVALEECAAHVARMAEEFRRRARLAFDLVARVPGFACARPMGAFYLFPDVSACFGRTSPAGRRIESALDLTEALLDEALVAAVPGEDFGGCGGRHVRLSFACSDRDLARGVERIGEFVASLR